MGISKSNMYGKMSNAVMGSINSGIDRYYAMRESGEKEL